MTNLTIQELETNKAIIKQKYDLCILENFVSVNIDQNPNNVEVSLIQTTDGYKAIERIIAEHKQLNTVEIVWSTIEEMKYHISKIMGYYKLEHSTNDGHFVLIKLEDFFVNNEELYDNIEAAKMVFDRYHYPESMLALYDRLIKRAVEVRKDQNATKAQQYVLSLSYALSVMLRNRAECETSS